MIICLGLLLVNFAQSSCAMADIDAMADRLSQADQALYDYYNAAGYDAPRNDALFDEHDAAYHALDACGRRTRKALILLQDD